MKTIVNLCDQRKQNDKLIGEYIDKLQQLHLSNLELDVQIEQLREGEEEPDNSNELAKGDRVVVLSPIKDRRGITGHIEGLSKSQATAYFKSDTNEKFSVRIGNLFKLKKKKPDSK